MQVNDESMVEDLENLSLDQKNNLDGLITNSEKLLSEVDKFIAHLKAQPRLDKVEYRHFRGDIKKELAALLKLKAKGLSPEKTFHSVKSSNLVFLQAVWDAAKRSSGVVSLKRHSSIVDVVAEGGLQWIKVSLISEKRLLHEMAKQGWEWGASSDSDDDEDDDDEDQMDTKPTELPDISIVKAAEALAKLAKETRVQYQHPSVTFILPNITAGHLSDIDAVLNMMRSQNITVICANSLAKPPVLTSVFPTPMVFDPFSKFSSTLNIDCTILLALVSDISHQPVPAQEWFNSAIRRQLEIEDSERLMPNLLWPAMADRILQCTGEAAQRMREITEFIGTETEKARMAVLLGEGEGVGRERYELITAFGRLSCHEVPKEWQLPVRVVDAVIDGDKLPPLARAVAKELTSINRSVCLYGWKMGYTTITSNRTTAKQIERTVEDNRKSDSDSGPDIWVCWTSRSLVAKEKDRKGV
jgi:hypothetical protein